MREDFWSPHFKLQLADRLYLSLLDRVAWELYKVHLTPIAQVLQQRAAIPNWARWKPPEVDQEATCPQAALSRWRPQVGLVVVVVLKPLMVRTSVVNLEQPVKETMVEMDSIGTLPFKAPVVVEELEV